MSVNRDRDSSRVGSAIAVLVEIGEAVDAGETYGRFVGKGAVAMQRQGSMQGAADQHSRDREVVGVDVVGEYSLCGRYDQRGVVCNTIAVVNCCGGFGILVSAHIE